MKEVKYCVNHPDVIATHSQGRLCNKCYCKEYRKKKPGLVKYHNSLRKLRKTNPDLFGKKKRLCDSCKERLTVARRLCSRCYRAYRKSSDSNYQTKQNEKARAWRANNSERMSEHYNRMKFRHLERLYKISKDEYINLLNLQGGVCAICKGVNINGKKLGVDHCHTTGTIRGLLCNNCNRALGCFRDNIEIMENGIRYLRDIMAREENIL